MRRGIEIVVHAQLSHLMVRPHAWYFIATFRLLLNFYIPRNTIGNRGVCVLLNYCFFLLFYSKYLARKWIISESVCIFACLENIQSLDHRGAGNSVKTITGAVRLIAQLQHVRCNSSSGVTQIGSTLLHLNEWYGCSSLQDAYNCSRYYTARWILLCRRFLLHLWSFLLGEFTLPLMLVSICRRQISIKGSRSNAFGFEIWTSLRNLYKEFVSCNLLNWWSVDAAELQDLKWSRDWRPISTFDPESLNNLLCWSL